MKTKEKHTELPWVNKGLNVLVSPDCVFGPLTWDLELDDQCLVDAEYIVRACNSHYEILEALEKLTDILSTEIKEDSIFPYTAHLDLAHKAILKAKGEL